MQGREGWVGWYRAMQSLCGKAAETIGGLYCLNNLSLVVIHPSRLGQQAHRGNSEKNVGVGVKNQNK